MTIYVVIAEDTSGAFVTPGSNGNINTGTTYRRTDYARCSIYLASNNVVTTPSPYRFEAKFPSALSSFWYHQRVYVSGIIAGNNFPGSGFADAGGVQRLLLRGTTTDGLLKLSKRNAAGTITDLATATAPLTNNTLHTFDFSVNYSTTGRFMMFVDGVLTLDTGAGGTDLTTDGATALSQVWLASPFYIGTMYFSEGIISDTDTRGMSLWTLPPQASGNTQGWLPDTVGNISEAVLSDSTFVSTTTADNISEWTTPTTPPAGVWAVSAIVQEARLQKGVSGPQNFDWITRTADGSDHTVSGDTLLATFSNHSHVWAQNPHTSADWVIDDIATGFNLGVVSRT